MPDAEQLPVTGFSFPTRMLISWVGKSLDLGFSTSIKWWQYLLSRFFWGIKIKASGTVRGSVNFSWMQCLLWSFWLIFLQGILEGGAQSILIKIVSFTDDVSCPGFKSRLRGLDEVITRSVLALFEDLFCGGGLYSLQHGHLCHPLERTSLRPKPTQRTVEKREEGDLERERARGRDRISFCLSPWIQICLNSSVYGDWEDPDSVSLFLCWDKEIPGTRNQVPYFSSTQPSRPDPYGLS